MDRAGFKCLFQVEIDPKCRAVLSHHWPDVPKWGDIRSVSSDCLPGVDVLIGGFPCQPASVAGKRKGTGDDRWLWPEFARLIADLRPRYVLVENVPGLLSVNDGQAFGEVLGYLDCLGYDTERTVIPASFFGAPHKRSRLYLVAYAEGQRRADQQGIFDPYWALERPGVGADGRAEHGSRAEGVCWCGLDTAGEEGVVAYAGSSGRFHDGSTQSQQDSHRTEDRVSVPYHADVEHASGLRWTQRRPEPARLQGRPGTPESSGALESREVGDSHFSGLEGWLESVRRGPHQWTSWPPGPEEHDRWGSVLAVRPDLAPAIDTPAKAEPGVRGLVDGVSAGLPGSGPGAAPGQETLVPLSRTDRLKMYGNAVVPAAAEMVGLLIRQHMDAP